MNIETGQQVSPAVAHHVPIWAKAPVATALDRAAARGALAGPEDADPGSWQVAGAERRLAAGRWLAETFRAAAFGESAEARARHARAMAVLGPVASGLAEGVCCYGADAAPSLWPGLRRALDRLADHLDGGRGL